MKTSEVSIFHDDGTTHNGMPKLKKLFSNIILALCLPVAPYNLILTKN